MDFDIDILGHDGLTRIMEGISWLETQASSWSAYAQQNANYCYYALQSWYSRQGPVENIPSQLWNRLQTLSSGQWLRNLTNAHPNPAEEDWEMIQLRSSRRTSFTVNIYEEHDLIED